MLGNLYETQNIILNSTDNISTYHVGNELEVRLPTSYTAKQGDQIALSNLDIYYSWFNVTALFNNTSFSYVWTDGTSNPVVMPPGSYTVDQISQFLQFTMQNNGHFLFNTATQLNVYYIGLAINSAYYATQVNCTAIPLTTLPANFTNPNNITLNGKCPQLVTGNNNFGLLIGYANNTSFPATLSTVTSQFLSTSTPIISPVTKIYVTCNWINNSRFSKYNTVIGSFTPNEPFLSLLTYQPPVLLKYDIVQKNYNTISIRFLDQNFNDLQINDKNQIDVTLVIMTTQN
jgi:hypothetical protein